MKKFMALAAIPLFAGFLSAQETTTTQTTTTRNSSWSGRIVDAGCRSTRTEKTMSSYGYGKKDRNTTTTESTTTSNDCPVTSSTTSYGLVTSDGQYIPLDPSSNTRVVQTFHNGQPTMVRIEGSRAGDSLVVNSIAPMPMEGEASRVAVGTPMSETQFDASYDGDDGRLIIGNERISWQDLNHTNRSRTWSYAEIKELKREGDHTLKIEAYHGGEHHFKVRGPFMNDEVYNMVADRIIAARPH